MLRHVLVIVLAISPMVWAQVEESDQAKRARRETDVVRAIRAEKDAVVNISTTVLMKRAEEDDIFNFFMPEIFRRERVPSHSLGSGFILHKSGYIITNAHVVQQAREVTVSFADKTTAKAEAVYADYDHDLAVIKIKPPKELHALPLGRGDDLMIGETVIAIGNPLGYQHTVTIGVVSATDRTLEFPGGQTYKDLIQTDASINPGNSGGPLLNINGELIGINSAIRGDAQNIGFAINVESLKRILPDLLNAENARRVNLGFKLSSEEKDRVRVVSIEEESPAFRAGMRIGDTIYAYNGKRFKNPVDLYVALLEQPVGSTMSLYVNRNGKLYSVDLPIAIKPKPNGLALARKHLGLTLKELTSAEVQEMGLGDSPLFVIEHVASGSSGAQAGLREGDIIYQLDRYRLESAEQLAQILDSAKRGQRMQAVIIRIWRGTGNIRRIVLKLD